MAGAGTKDANKVEVGREVRRREMAVKPEATQMATRLAVGRKDSLGVIAMVAGLLGLATFWLFPFGLLVGAVGLLAGLLGVWFHYPLGGRPLVRSAWGLLLSAVALAVSVAVPLTQWWDRPLSGNPTSEPLPREVAR